MEKIRVKVLINWYGEVVCLSASCAYSPTKSVNVNYVNKSH